MSVTPTAVSDRLIPNHRLRARVLAAGVPFDEIAARIYGDGPRVHDHAIRLRRALGTAKSHRRDGTKYYQRRVSQRLAVSVCDAIHVDPYEIGL